MERPMTEWNDDRLDELNERVKDGFAEVDKRFDKVDERFVRLEGEMKAGFMRVEDRFEVLHDRFDRIYYAIVLTIVGLAGSLLANNVWS